MGAEIVLALVAVGVGALVQGSIGFGFALVAVPILALLRPDAVPAVVLLLAFPTTAFVGLRERRSIDVPALVWITGGRLLGAAAGAGLLALIPQSFLTTLFGFLIVAAVLMSFLGPSFEARRSTQLTGGVASGVMGTTVGLGGPPVALVNQERPGPELRSTLAMSFFLGNLGSLAALALVGKVEGWHALLALQLLPGLILGMWTSHWVAELFDSRWLRPVVLAFAATSGLVVIVVGPPS